MTISLLSLGQTVQRRTTALAWAICSLVAAAATTDLLLTVAHENGTHRVVHLSDVFATLGLSLACLAFAAVGAFIVSRRPGNRIGWLMLTFGLTLEVQDFCSDYVNGAVLSTHQVLPLRLWANWASNWTFDPVIYALFLLLLLFPTGQLINPRLRPVAWIGLGACLLFTLIDMFQEGPMRHAAISSANPLGVVSIPRGFYHLVSIAAIGFALVAALSLLRRFWVARGVERQQLKWFTYAIAAFVAVLLTAAADSALAEPVGVLLLLALVAVPVSMGIAILRYRLYDIDLLINRTLVYASLTALLGGLYVGQIIALQALFRAVTGQQSDVAVAISTLMIAALFNPLRHRIQDFIARTFYRRKYDAAKVLTAFGATCKDETDLDALRSGLVRVVEEAVQPVHVSVWLHDGGHAMHADRATAAIRS